MYSLSFGLYHVSFCITISQAWPRFLLARRRRCSLPRQMFCAAEKNCWCQSPDTLHSSASIYLWALFSTIVTWQLTCILQTLWMNEVCLQKSTSYMCASNPFSRLFVLSFCNKNRKKSLRVMPSSYIPPPTSSSVHSKRYRVSIKVTVW